MKALISILILVFANLALAADDSTTTMATTAGGGTLANINQHDMQIGGGFNWSHTSERGRGTSDSYSLYPSVEYFVANHFSLGGTVSYTGFRSERNNYTGYGLGPSASFYFLTQDKIAAYIGQVISMVKYSDENETRTRGSTSLGIKYFAVPQVAFGVALSSTYDIGQETEVNPKTDITSLGGSFSFYY